MAQVMLGYDSGSQGLIEKFEADLNLDNSGIMNEVFFMNFSRLLTKDQVKKGTFSLTLGQGAWTGSPFSLTKVLTDTNASDTGGTATSIGGDYGVLFDASSAAHGLVFYQAINSTIYFCRATAGKFNYSTNPTYVSGGACVVKNVASDQSVAYITTVGLYSANNELLAVAKLSEPLKKDPSNELTLRVRLDY